jgi:protocatechuate 3,4-dioxygenase beta subunit/methionine-rich copper-binding protein CopC
MAHMKNVRTKSSRFQDLLKKTESGIERKTRLKVEQLEVRLVPSSNKTIPAGDVPAGLGTAYTTMSEQAHGITVASQSPGQNVGAPTVTMAQLEAYLQKLKLDFNSLTNSGAGVPAAYQNLVSAGVPAPLLNQLVHMGPQDGGDDPDHSTPTSASVFSMEAYLKRLQMDPQAVTGISNPAQLPTLLNGFDGMNFLDSVNGYVPPDTDMAVGPQFVIETVNAQIQFYDKATGAALLPNTPLNVFFGQTGESPFDPVVTYDDIAGRFIVASDSFSGDLLLAVSKDSNPLDGFTNYDINVSEGGFFPDYTKIGWNADQVVVEFNMYPGPGNFHVQLLSFAASSIFSSSPPSTLTLGTDYFSNDRTNPNDFTLAPASMHGATPGMPMYLVEENGFANGSQMDVVTATNLLSTSPSYTDTIVNVDPYTLPPAAQQPGGFIETNDTRMLNAEWRDGILVADHAVGLATDSDAHARWYEFSTTGTPSLIQDGTISPAPGTSTYFPAITIAPGDIIAMVYNESSPTEFPSVYETARVTSDPLGTMETPVLAHAGTATYSDFAFRWGDYSGISVDPVDGSIWTGAEYSTSLLSGFPANWATWISHFSVAPSVVASNPAAGSVVSGTAPTTFSLTFTEPIDPTSINAADFTVNGTSADSASLSADGLTITYTFNTSPVVNQGVESMSLPAGAVKGAAAEDGSSAFTASFYYVLVQLQVSATSPAVGSVLAAPVTDLVVQFNKAFDPYTISASDFQVSQGTVVSAKILTSQAVDLTLSGVTHDGTMTLTVPAGAILDTLGVPGAAFSGTYIIQVNSQAYPTPLAGKNPGGSLIYDPSVTGGINFAGDTDTYTLALAAGQTLSLALTVDPSLIGTITLVDPNGHTVATATGGAAGQTVVIETAPISIAGTYSLVVGGAGGTGNYTLQAILNAVFKQATDPNNSIATALNLDAGGISLGTTPASFEAGVVGTLGAADDYYFGSLAAGQSVTVAVKGNGGTATIEILDASGNVLAMSSPGGGVDGAISDFVAPYSGNFYVQVSGAPGLQYDLVATLNADFGLHANSFNNAQALNGVNVVLGAITKGEGALQALDLQSFAFSNIYQTDPVTGAFGSHIVSPTANGFFLFGQNMAFDGTYTYYSDGYGGSGSIFKLDSTGNVVASATGPNSFAYTGLAYLNGLLYAAAPFDTNIYIFDPNTLAFLGTINDGITDSAIVGLAGDPDRGVLWAVGQVSSAGGKLYEIDPASGSVIAEAGDHNQGFYEQDIAYANGELIVSEADGSYGAGNNFLDEYNPDTFGFLQRIAPPYTFAASGLAGDGVGGQTKDWYQFNVNAGDNLVITTTTPGGSSANGLQFINDLNPTINLYDASGNLVATATGNAADGRNDVIDWTALSSGSYRVQILGASKDNIGEYTIAVQGATGGLNGFTVTSTTPANGADLNFEASDITVQVSNSTLLSSVVPGDLTIDGAAATGVTIIDGHTFDFTFPATADGVHSVSISGLVDIHGAALTPYSFSFATDTVPPSIVSASLVEGSVFSPAPQTVTDVVTFSEPMNENFNPFALSLFGEIRGVSYSASTSWDATGTVLTITYANLPADAYQFNLYTFGFQDLAGNFLSSGLTTDFQVTGGNSAITNMQPVQPLGSLVYQGTVDNLLVSSSDMNSYSLSIDPRQTLSVIVTPVTSGMVATVTLISPTGHVLGVATSPSPGAPAVLPAVQSSAGGIYTIQVTGGPGEYKVEAVLNAYLDPAAYGGLPNSSIATATPIDAYANKFAGNNDRTAVLGALSAPAGGGLFSTDRFTQGLYSVNSGTGAATLIGPLSDFTSFSGMAIDPNSGTTFISDVFDPNDGQWSLATIDRTSGQETIIGPQNDTDVHALVLSGGTLYGFSFNQGLGTLNTSTGLFTPSFPFDTMPEPMENAAIDPSSGTIYAIGQISNSIYTIDLSTGTANFVGSTGINFNFLVGLAFTGGSLFALGNDTDFTPNNNLYAVSPSTGASTLIGPNGFEIEPDAMTAPANSPTASAGESAATYSFSLSQGESATLVLEILNSKKASFSLYDENGDLLAISGAGATNYSQGLNNFVAPADGTYYVQVTGDPGVKFNLVLTRGADFTTQKHTTLATAQDLSATQQSGDSKQGGALGYLVNPTGANVSSTIEGIDFNTSNCGCLPPDTNATAGNGFVAEAVNLQFRVWDTSGNQLLDESLTTLFGQTALSDPYVVYDAAAGHWYVTVVGSADESKVMLAISTDANPLDGFSHVYNVPVAASGDLADFPKVGYNSEAIILEANDFGDGHAVVTAVDKAQAIAGTLVDYQSTPAFQFRALAPAQMNGTASADTMWFMAATGDPTYDGTHPNTIRVTEMTNILSNSPVYTDFSLTVNTYGPNSGAADQPGAPGSVATNDVSTTSVQYLNDEMVTAFSASTPADGFVTTKAHWYQVDVTGGTPVLVQEGLIDPGLGVATYFPSAAIDPSGNIGITYMESSSSEFVSSYVAGHIAGTPLGTTTAGTDFAPGAGSMPESFREGDYSSVAYDPGTGEFWAANEYSGPNASSDIWNTRIASFTVFAGLGTDYYSVSANEGDNLHFATTTPAGGPNQFDNGFYPELLLYDPNGNLVAIANGNASDGRNSVIDFTVPGGDAGTWTIEVTPSPSTLSPTSGEYGLLATGATGALTPMAVTGTTPADGSLIQPPTDYIVTFNHSVLGTSLTPGELTVNGVPAIAVTLVDAHTVDWTIDPSSIPSGDRVLNTAVLSADPSTAVRVTDVSGSPVADFSSTFTTDNVAPSVVSSSVADGDVFSPAPFNLTEVVTFSEPMNTAATTAASFDLHGNFRNQDIAADSFSWDATGTVLTINYANLPDDTYTLTLLAGGFQDLVGLAPASNFTVDFAVALGTAAYPTPMTPVPPLGDLIYTGSDSHVLVTPTDIDSMTLALNAGGTLTVVGTPTNSAQLLMITILDPSNNPIGTATASAAGQAVMLQGVPTSTTGTYTIEFSDAGGTLGQYQVQAYLNTLLKVGQTNITLGTAQDISGSSFVLGPGNADRLAVLGSLPSDIVHNGDAYVAARYYGFYFGGTVSDILRVNAAGQVTKVIPVPAGDTYDSLSGVELDPVDNMLYAAVTTNFGASSVSGELVKIDPITGAIVGTIALPDDPAENFFYYPYGFSIASDGTFWIAQPNSNNIIHTDANGNVLASYSTGTTQPESASARADGNVYFIGNDPTTGSGVYLLDTTSGSVSLFASQSSPNLTTIAATGGVWSGDFFNGAQRFDDSGNLVQNVGFYGSVQAQTDPAANVWVSDFGYYDLFRFDPSGNLQLATFAPGALGLTVWGVDNPNPPPQDTQDFYSFHLSAGQSATVAIKGLNGLGAQIEILDGSGNILATGSSGFANVSQAIENFVAPSDGTYYVEVTGDPGVKYSLTVTRGANFDLENHSTIYNSEPLTGTNGVLGALDPGGNLVIGSQIEGIDFNGSNCGCLPPDTNAAVGGNYIVENVNVQIRVYDKTSGAILLDEPLSTFYGASSGGDPYIVYDDISNHWYAEGLDSSDGGFFLNVSKDANPLDGFTTYHLVNGLGGPITDYPKMGFNKDAIFISYNNFGSGGSAATIISIDKAAALSGTLTYFVNTPEFQFRAMPPAQMHGDTTGGVEWFVSTSGTDAGGNTIRVTEMTNYLSNSPSFTYTELPVNPYQQAFTADQPGGSWTTFPNTTTTQVQYRNGMLVTALASATAADGFVYPKGLYYEINVSGGTPTLALQGVIDPGQGVAVQMPSVAIDIHGNLGFTWMEGSSSEYVSMWVGSLDTQGHFSSFDSTPNAGFFFENFRIGDYSSTVVDPTDGTTFWSANEYSGPDAGSDIWRTRITSFSVPPAVNNDWYSIDVAAGNSLFLQSSTPSDQGGQFPNDVSVNIELYDTFGNLVASGTVLPDGRNESLFFNAPVTGQYYIHVFNNPGSSGEYYLQVDTASYAAGGVSGEVYNDQNGSGSITASDAGLDNWEVDLFDSNNNFIASQLTHGGGQYDFEGLAPGTYTVSEVLQSGWTQTQPAAPFTYTVTVSAGSTSGGWDFGNFQLITISGQKFNDLNGDGAQEAGESGLPGWTIDLLDPTGAIIASTVTDANGNYSFTGIGPGTYTVQEEQQAGWVQTDPAAPGTYTVTATSGKDASGLLFGNFQLVTISGTVYNDLGGTGVNNGDPGLQGWTVNLYDMNGNQIATTTSAKDGSYSFANLFAGIYTVAEVNQDGWYQTDPVKPPGTYTLTVTSGANLSGEDFGNFGLVSVTGTVYEDKNGNGSRDPGEPGLQNWTIELLNTSGNIVATTTSDANGNYEFDNVFPGTFVVAEILQSGWTQTQPVSPGTYTFTTQSATNETGLNFGNFTTGAVSGTVFNDVNGNGSQDAGDVGLSGWTIDLIQNTSVIATTTTDGNGFYSFAGLEPGLYTVREEVQDGWVVTQPFGTDYTIPVVSSVDVTGLNYGDFQTVTLSGETYNDLNGNGANDPGEPGLQGWTINLLNAAGAIKATTTTDANGNYEFDNIGPGGYYITEAPQSGWKLTSFPAIYPVKTASGQNVPGMDFGNFQLVSFEGTVYKDINGNGTQDPGEPGLTGWTVNLEDASGNVLATTTSDASGNYKFQDVANGTFIVAQVVQSGWIQTQPAMPPSFWTITTTSGTNSTAVNFGNSQPGSFTGTAYNDLNGDGTRQPGEPALANWTVDLISNGAVVATTKTGSNGHYTFKNVTPGAYTIAEEVHTGWVVTQPGAPGTYTLNTVSGTSVTVPDFGNFHTISAQGSIFNDVNGNGVQDSGEPGLQGWTVDLLDASGSVVQTQTTDSTGHYTFNGVGPGSYSIAQEVQDGWVQTHPGYPVDLSFTTTSGQNLTALRFGDHASADLHPLAAIDNGQAGYAETGSWSTVGGGFNGSNRVATTTHGSGNTATATYDFTGLAAGQYDVYVTFFGKNTYTAAAPFSVYDGGTHLGNAFINESILVTQAQGVGRAQGSFGGVGWLGLGTFSISSGELVVVLGNNATGSKVDADGVLIVPHVETPGTPSSISSSSTTGSSGTGGSGVVNLAIGNYAVSHVIEASNNLSSSPGTVGSKTSSTGTANVFQQVSTQPGLSSATEALGALLTATPGAKSSAPTNAVDNLFSLGYQGETGLGII